MRPEVVDYRDAWSDAFEKIAALIRSRFGPLAQRVDHIGSTSVPGLCAKDVIDVQVTVTTLDSDEIDALMERVGFRSRPDIVRDHVPPGADPNPDDWRKRYFDTEDGKVHVHVRESGRPNQRYPILFRDFLRAHPNVAEAYGQAKQRLAALCEDTGTYADAKDPVCDIIMQSAGEWAVRTSWRAPD